MVNLLFFRWIALAGTCTAITAAIASADVVVSAWDLRTRVADNLAGEQNLSGTTQIQNPISAKFTAAIAPSQTTGNYQVAWSADSLAFLLQSTLHAESLQGAVSAFGFMNVTPQVDSILTIDGSLLYNMPVQPARAALVFTVSRNNPSQTLFSSSQTRTNFIGTPSGTILLNDSVLLPAGQSWRIQWGLAIDHFNAPIPGAASDATGHLAFQINPVPESITLGPLAFAAFVLSRRRRRGLPR